MKKEYYYSEDKKCVECGKTVTNSAMRCRKCYFATVKKGEGHQAYKPIRLDETVKRMFPQDV